MHEMKLTDNDAVALATRLRMYFEDCVAEDPSTTHPGNLSVRELLEDLECSTTDTASERISAQLTAILDLFA